MKCAVIVVAAGLGTRFGATTIKALAPLSGKPLLLHSLTVFEQSIKINSIIIVGHTDHLPHFRRVAKPFSKVDAIVAGGGTRADSVRCGLKALRRDIDTVLVHDAARPRIDDGMVMRLVAALGKAKAAILAVPVKATIKEVSPHGKVVRRTLQRDLLWEVQTPQGFKRDVLEKAHRQGIKVKATDDAMLVERLGIKVQVVLGDYRNIKITTPEDIKLAKVL